MFEKINDIFYCGSRRNLNNIELIESISFREGQLIPFANINILLNNEASIIALLSHNDISKIISKIPGHLRTLMALDNFTTIINRISEKESYKNNFEIIQHVDDYNLLQNTDGISNEKIIYCKEGTQLFLDL